MWKTIKTIHAFFCWKTVRLYVRQLLGWYEPRTTIEMLLMKALSVTFTVTE